LKKHSIHKQEFDGVAESDNAKAAGTFAKVLAASCCNKGFIWPQS
jgi:hypothetical protein